MTLVPDSLQVKESAATQRNSKEDWFGYEDYRCTFVAWGICEASWCKQHVAVAGYGDYLPTCDENGDFGYHVPCFYPRMVTPAPPLLIVPKDCPKAVSDALTSTFALFWVDKNACATRLRTAVESWLTHLGIEGKRAGGGSIPLNMRLERLRVLRPDLVTFFDPLRHMGNDGTHEGGDVLADDLLKAFEMIEFALHREYGQASAVAFAQELSGRYDKKRR